MEQRVMKEWSQKLLPDPEARYFHKTFDPEPNETHENVKFDIRFPGNGCHMSSTVFIERTVECQIDIDEPLATVFDMPNKTRPFQNAVGREPKFTFASPGMTLQNNATKIIAQYNSTTNEVLNPNIWMPEYTRLYQNDLKNLVKHSGRAFEKRDPICYRDGIFNFNRLTHFLGAPSTYTGFGEDFMYKLNMFPECRNERRIDYDKIIPNPLQAIFAGLNDYIYKPNGLRDIFFRDKIVYRDYPPQPLAADPKMSYVRQEEDGTLIMPLVYRPTNDYEFQEFLQENLGPDAAITAFTQAVQEVWDGKTFKNSDHILDRGEDNPLAPIIDLYKTIFPSKEEYAKVYSKAYWIKAYNDAERLKAVEAQNILPNEMHTAVYTRAVLAVVQTGNMTDASVNGGAPIPLLDPVDEYKWQDSMGWGVDLSHPLGLFTKPTNVPIKLIALMYTFAFIVDNYIKESVHADISFLRQDKTRLVKLKQSLQFVDVDMNQMELRYAALILSEAYGRSPHSSMTDAERAEREEAHREANAILDTFRRNGVSDVSHDGMDAYRGRVVNEMRNIVNKYDRFLGQLSLVAEMKRNSPNVFGDGTLANAIFEKKDGAADGIPIVNEDGFSAFMVLIGQTDSPAHWGDLGREAITWQQLLDDRLSVRNTLNITNVGTMTVKFLEPLCVSMMRPSEFVDFGCWGDNSQILPYVKRYNLSMEFPTVDKCRYFELDDLKPTDIYVDPMTGQSHFPQLTIKNISSKLLCTFVERSISLPRVVPTMNMMVYRLNEEDIEVELGETKSFFFNQIEIRNNVSQVMIFCKSKEVNRYSLIADRTASLTKVHIKTDISNQNIDLNSREMIDAVTMRCYPQYCPPRGAGGNLLAMPYNEFPRAKEVLSGFNHLFGEIAITQDFAPKIKCDVFIVLNYKDTALKVENECIRHIRYLQ